MVCNGTGMLHRLHRRPVVHDQPDQLQERHDLLRDGAMTCVDGGNKAAGTTCGTNHGLQRRGTCVACTAGAACTTNPSICKNGTTSCATGAP